MRGINDKQKERAQNRIYDNSERLILNHCKLVNDQDAIALYNHISEVESRFNNIELSYRKLASHWLLVALGAIGYLATEESENNGVDWGLILVISIVAAVGISIIWYLDSHVYHRLLDAAYKEGKKFEDNYKFLPKIRSNMSFKSEYHYFNAVSGYYFSSITLLILTAAFALCKLVGPIELMIYIAIVCDAITILIIVFIIMEGEYRNGLDEACR